MARAMITTCQLCCVPCDGDGDEERGCCQFFDKSCPARIYLAAHGYAKAWEVTP